MRAEVRFNDCFKNNLIRLLTMKTFVADGLSDNQKSIMKIKINTLKLRKGWRKEY